MSECIFLGKLTKGLPLRHNFYPPHLEVGNLYCHVWRGHEQIGRHVECLVCKVTNNTRNRNGDARFIRRHRRCGFDR
jgi:hypothetical protein